MADVVFAVDMRCCVCESLSGLPPRRHSGQIHHLDGDPSKHSKENLVWLCLEHHEEAGTTGQAARRLSADVIRRYRADLERRVAQHRTAARLQRASPKTATAFSEALDALIVMDVRKLRFRAGSDWKAIENALDEIGAYPEGMGFTAKQAILEYLGGVAGRARIKMPSAVSEAVGSVTVATTDLYFLGPHMKKRIRNEDDLIHEMAADVGQSLVYDGSLYLHDLNIVESGAEILWRLLSFATLTRNRRVREMADRAFATGFDGATRGNEPDAQTILAVFRNEGLRGTIYYPQLPTDLVLKMMDHAAAGSQRHRPVA